MKYKATIMSKDGISRDVDIDFIENSYIEKDGYLYRTYNHCYRTPKALESELVIFVVDKQGNFMPDMSDKTLSNIVKVD